MGDLSPVLWWGCCWFYVVAAGLGCWVVRVLCGGPLGRICVGVGWGAERPPVVGRGPLWAGHRLGSNAPCENANATVVTAIAMAVMMMSVIWSLPSRA